MNREQFIAARKQRWREFEKLVRVLAEGKRKRRAAGNLGELPYRYRQVCQDLALAKHRQYGRELVQRLNQLALLGHEQLHKRRRRVITELIDFVRFGFPSIVRAEAKYIWTAHALFYVPFGLMMLAGWFFPSALYAVLDPESLRNAERMYDPAINPMAEGRASESDLMMFAHYIQNNIGVAFRTFAGGVLVGLGSGFFLVYNGLVIGCVFAHLTRNGLDEQLYPFVVGHGAFELTAIVFAGAAGLKVGLSILSPGRRTRTQALVQSGQVAVRIVFGATGMLLIAAFIEGFWSPSSAPSAVKYAVGAVLWLIVTLYFVFAGRTREA